MYFKDSLNNKERLKNVKQTNFGTSQIKIDTRFQLFETKI